MDRRLDPGRFKMKLEREDPSGSSARSASWMRGGLTSAAFWSLPLVFLGFFFYYPLLSIFHLAFRDAVRQGLDVLQVERIWRPLGFTLWQALLSTALTLMAGLPAAYVLARYSFIGKRLVQVAVILPFILPTVVAAAGFNALLGPRGWVNLVLMNLLRLSEPPVQIMNSLAIILLVHVFYNLGIVIRLVGAAFAQLDPRLMQAARVLGA